MSEHLKMNARAKKASKNPALPSALKQAEERSQRDSLPMFVYVQRDEPFNKWFVRSPAEGKPDHSHLFKEVNTIIAGSVEKTQPLRYMR